MPSPARSIPSARATVPRIDAASLAWRGHGLERPECVLATRAGDLYTADWRGGVAHIRPDGTQTLYRGTLPGGRAARPNGIALLADGSFLMAHLGEESGGLLALSRDGRMTEVLTRVDGVDLPPSNFVAIDGAGRTWLTVSTRLAPRARAYNNRVADGFIVLIDGRGERIVADGLGYTNEALVSPDGRWLYVNETFHKRLSRFPLAADGSLGPRQTVTTFGRGAFPDGLAFDATGAVWVACVLGNQLIRVLPDGAQQLVLDDGDPAYVDAVEDAWSRAELGRALMDRPHQTRVRNLSSVAFGGPELRTVLLGSLAGGAVAAFELPREFGIHGHPPAHWAFSPEAR